MNDISVDCVTEAILLLGEFIFEIEAELTKALASIPGITTRLYYPSDKRVACLYAVDRKIS